jgi:hypothetical protein
MLNTSYEVPPYPTATQEDIDDLISFLDAMNSEEYPHKYTIGELYTDVNGDIPAEKYELYNLTMECEKGILIASDKEEILWDKRHRIHSIPTDHIMYITFHNCIDAITLTIGNDDTYGLIIRIFY